MAYKFQLGAAKLSGSVTSTSTVDAEGALSGALIQVDDASGIAGNGLDNSSGKLTIDLDGSTGITVDADGISLASIPNSSLENSTISGKALGANLDALTAGNGISMTSYNGSAAVSDLTIARSGSNHALKLDGGGLAVLVSGSGTGLSIDGDGLKLASVPNATLANSAVTLSQGAGMAAMGSVSLGGSVTVAVDGVLEDLDTLGAASSDGEFIVATGAGTFAYESGATVRTSLGLGTGNSPQFTGLTLTGDLIVSGTTTTINSTELTIDDRVIRIGDGLADLDAAVASGSGFEIGNNLASFKLNTDVDGGGTDGFASSVPLSASTYYGDGSNLTGVQASDAVLTVNDLADAATLSGGLAAGFYLAGNLSQDTTVHLSSSAGGWTDGEVVYIKNNDANNTLTIVPSGTNGIDGTNGQSIRLETQGSAVTLVRKGTHFFIV